MKKHKCFMLVLGLIVLFGACASTLTEDERLSEQAFGEISRHNYLEAERYLNEALFLNPNNPYALLNMGVVYQNTGRMQEAQVMYEKVVDLDSSDKAVVSNKDSSVGKTLIELARGNLEILEKQRAEAEAAAEKAAQESVSASLFQEEVSSELEEEFPPVTETATLEDEREEPMLPSPPAEEVEADSSSEVKEGYYITQEGDSLSIIAGYSEVYDDPLKWPSLFRLNIEEFEETEITKSFQDQELAEGLELKFVTPREAEENLAELGRKLWAVNVISVQRPAWIAPYISSLTRNGFRAYITEAEVNGREWTRLRVGFFEDHAEAKRNGETIWSLLNMTSEPMPVKISDSELNSYGGY